MCSLQWLVHQVTMLWANMVCLLVQKKNRWLGAREKSHNHWDYIIEYYTDVKRDINVMDHSSYNWYRIREWVPERREYILHSGFHSELVAKAVLRHWDVIEVDKVPVVDLVLLD